MLTSAGRRIPQLKIAVKECRALYEDMKSYGKERSWETKLARHILTVLERELNEAEAAELLVSRRKGEVIVHIDGDMRNNHISNLRIETLPKNRG